MKTQNNSLKPQFPFKKSIWVIMLLIVLSAGVLFSPGCSPVSLSLDIWGIKFQLEKGECSFPQLSPQ